LIETQPQTFAEFDLEPSVARAVEEAGYVTPTPVQAAAIPPFRSGDDLLVQAQTGTGKTAAFGIPIMEILDPEAPGVHALVLAPTRELATQITNELRRLGHYRKLRVCSVYGGSPMKTQIEQIKRASVVIGTPGRVLDLIGRGHLDLSQVAILVLDEADRMLDMGFLPDVERIIRHTPRSRQTGLFSATISTLVKRLSARYMRDPKTVSITPEERTVSTVRQLYFEVAERDKPEALVEILEKEEPQSAIIFCHTQIAVDRVSRQLQRRGITVRAIHGSLSQSEREGTLRDFRDGKLRYLVATNVAARGLDILHVSHVINYDVAEDSETYIHRIGRTARMGREGTAITFVAEWDADAFKETKKVGGENLQLARLDLYTPA
jgi:ATP-dependent RNA helicase DeaD